MSRKEAKTQETKEEALIRKQSELDSLNKEINIHTIKLEETKKLVVAKGIEHNEISDKVEHAKKTYDEHSTQVSKELKDKLGESLRLDLVIADKQKEIIALESSHHSLDTTYHAKKKELEDDFEAKQSDLVNRISQLTANRDALSSEYEDLSNNRIETLEAIDEFKRTKEVLEKDIANLNERKSSLSATIDSQTKKAFSIADEISANKKEQEVLNNSIATLKQTLLDLAAKRDVLATEVSKMTVERTQLDNDKLSFEKIKQAILLRETFIKERYEQAGVKYE